MAADAAEEHVIYRIANAPVREYPYPHLYVTDVFPADYYAALRRNWPDTRHLKRLDETGRVNKGTYSERYIMPLDAASAEELPDDIGPFWEELAAWMLSGSFASRVFGRFGRQASERFGASLADVQFVHEALVVRDHTHYALGPHTDHPRKVLSLLFYCPDDDTKRHLGTSIYRPVDPSFRCAGGPHYPHEKFKRVTTMEYRPNTLFAFFKSDTAFHGVDPIRDADVARDLILYDIRVAE